MEAGPSQCSASCTLTLLPHSAFSDTRQLELTGSPSMTTGIYGKLFLPMPLILVPPEQPVVRHNALPMFSFFISTVTF